MSKNRNHGQNSGQQHSIKTTMMLMVLCWAVSMFNNIHYLHVPILGAFLVLGRVINNHYYRKKTWSVTWRLASLILGLSMFVTSIQIQLDLNPPAPHNRIEHVFNNDSGGDYCP